MWSLFAVLFSTWDKNRTKYATEKKRAQRKENLLVSSLICLVKIGFKRSDCCTILYKNNLQPSKQLAHFLRALFARLTVCCLGGPWSWSLPVIDGFNELHRCRELHPPVGLLSRQTAGIKATDILDSGQQTGGICLYQHKYQNGDEVICSRDGVLIGQTQEVHDRGAHPQDALHFVPRRLVSTYRPDFRLCGRPRCLPKIHLWYLQSSVICSYYFRQSLNMFMKDLVTKYVPILVRVESKLENPIHHTSLNGQLSILKLLLTGVLPYDVLGHCAVKELQEIFYLSSFIISRGEFLKVLNEFPDLLFFALKQQPHTDGGKVAIGHLFVPQDPLQ